MRWIEMGEDREKTFSENNVDDKGVGALPVCSIQQLARFFCNKSEDKVSNYSFLIGSGCSISSNVRSGEQLITEWKKQVLDEFNNGFEIQKSEDDLFSNNNYLQWYNPIKPYQSLFEHLFPMKELRRKFVEKEVERKEVLPGIGYALLVKLARTYYADSFFTTNFDDLINEAFYIYGGFSFLRPAVCSHESSIDSISIYTTRPKVIKLHGDYLFENIHATLKETEMLGENSKLKFSEFAKEKGLVVIGYSGNDDSIMNALNELAEDPKNFKNGVFWCVRDEGLINARVREFIKKCNNVDKRAWIIRIDGFDEFMCELDLYIDPNGKALSFSPVFGNDSNDRINEFYKKNLYYKNAKSDLLKRQYVSIMKSLKNETEDETPFDLAKNEEYRQKKNSDIKFSRINNLLDLKNYAEALDELGKIDVESLNTNDRYEFFQLSAFANYKNNDNKKTISILNDLVDERPFDAQNYINLSLVFESFQDRIDILNKGVRNNPTNIELLSRKSDILMSEFENSINCPDDIRTEIEETLNLGIHLSNAVDNGCWIRLFDYYYKEGEANNNYSKCEKLLNDYEDRFPNDYSVIFYKAKILKVRNENPTAIVNYIKDHKSEICRDIDLIDSLLADYGFDANSDKEALYFLTKNYYLRPSSVVINKANILFGKYRDPNKAITLLQKYLENNNSLKVIKVLIDYLLTTGRTDEAEELIKQNSLSDSDFKNRVLGNRKDWKAIVENCKKDLVANPNSERIIMEYSHALLKLNENREAMRFLQDKLESIQFNNLRLLINYTLAKNESRKNTKNTDMSRLEKLTSDEDKSLASVASCLLCGKKKEAIVMLSKIIAEDYGDYYFAKDMFVFEKYLDPDDWQSVFDKLPKVNIIDEDTWSRILSSI